MDSQNRVQKHDLRVYRFNCDLTFYLPNYLVNASSRIESFKMLDDHASGRPVYIIILYISGLYRLLCLLATCSDLHIAS